MTHRTRTMTITAAAAVASLLLAGCSGDSDDSNAETPPAEEQQQGDAALTAETVVDELSALYPLPNPRDNTSSCNSAEFGDDACVQLITTDPVSVYHLPTTEAAERWAESFSESGEQHGQFMLRWSDEYPLSDDARTDLSERMSTLVD
ncbi:hypothetical protein MTQ13_03090 [Streptomyces sp. XM4011]|uniref:hypothetical protein n=1 Tax=Streptomyces sp. XM4011 TaxID=2929780 RepID=UPI001FF70878|nr:hypothetical protein [Streptomyces sp. XM4011]MCK1813266.1 hypothetical protein [Streptomyces sp. XM4011]